jgi:hypothetical protein
MKIQFVILACLVFLAASALANVKGAKLSNLPTLTDPEQACVNNIARNSKALVAAINVCLKSKTGKNERGTCIRSLAELRSCFPN